MTEVNGLLSFAKKVGIVCGAAIAAGTVVQVVGGFLWGYATRPIVDQIREERLARQYADSLIVNQIAGLASAMVFQPGSPARDQAVRRVITAPSKLEEQKETQGGHE